MQPSVATVFPLLALPACAACGVDAVVPIHVCRAGASRQLGIVGCRGCGLVFVHPRPSDEQLEALYTAPSGWERRTRHLSEKQVEVKLEKKRTHYRRHLELLARHLPAPGAKTGRRRRPRLLGGSAKPRALDFGCGLGSWLDVLQDSGWATTGIEPGPTQRGRAARRHPMIGRPPCDGSFDLVLANHVLEHVGDPLGVLRELAACAKPGGWLLLAVPDLGRLAEHRDAGYVIGTKHICAFTATSLTALLNLAGCAVVAVLDSEEWDAAGPKESKRLKILARRSQEPVQPPEDPLQPALGALRSFAAQAAGAA